MAGTGGKKKPRKVVQVPTEDAVKIKRPKKTKKK